MVGLALAGILASAVIVAVIAQSRSRRAAPLAAGQAEQTYSLHAGDDEDEVIATGDASSAAAAGEAAPLDAGPGASAAHEAPPTVAGVRPRPKARPAPAAPAGPILTKKEAEQVLRPEVLSCMKQHGVHYLITRLGNNRRGAAVPPLGLTGTSIVDYRPTPGFASTPLGRCVARAGSAVRAPAYRGDYIYLGLRNDSVPDPLADAPARLDSASAKQALSALDDEARDCAARSPAGSRPGESVSVTVTFQGATGRVSHVRPHYVDGKSAYARCLSSVYGKAAIGKFREIEQKVVHTLPP